MGPQHPAHRVEAGVFVAVQQHGDEQRLGLAAGQVDEGGTGQRRRQVLGGAVEQAVGQMVENGQARHPVNPVASMSNG